MVSLAKRTTFYDYENFIKTGASLMVAMIIIDYDYEEAKSELPPHVLEFDLQGTLIIDNNAAVLEGGEVKSSSSRISPYFFLSPYCWLICCRVRCS
jgi:hypothetical protein